MSKNVFRLALCAMLLALCVSAQAQQPKKVARIGYVSNSDPASDSNRTKATRLALRELGYIEGQNIAIEYRFGESKGPAHVRELAADLVRLKVDLMVATGTPSALTAKSATTTIPIVMVSSGDLVAAGLVASLARPGGNAPGSRLYRPN